MKKNRWVILLFFIGTGGGCTNLDGRPPIHGDGLRVIIIRHAEKPTKGDNLNCQGLNRSLQLPKMFVAKFGVPDYSYVPAMDPDSATRHSRMFQTIIPLAVKYDLTVNSMFVERDSAGLAAAIKKKSGTVLVVWEHRALTGVVRALGVRDFDQHWSDDDYDSIWIITFSNGIAKITYDKEGLAPDNTCPF